MFNFKKKENLLGHYVKFSKATVKNNPDMIKREYERLLDNTKSEIKQIEKNISQEKIPIIISVKDLQKIEIELSEEQSYLYHDGSYGHYVYFDGLKKRNVTAYISQKSKTGKKILNISPVIIDKFLKNILKYEDDIKILKEEFNNIKKEFNWFLKKIC